MNLNALYMQSKFIADESFSAAKSSSTMDKGFDSFMDKAAHTDTSAKGSQFATAKSRSARNMQGYKVKTVDNKQDSQNQQESKSSDDNTVNSANTNEYNQYEKSIDNNVSGTSSNLAASSQEIRGKESSSEDNTDDTNNEVITKLSAMLNVSTDAIQQILASLNIKPVDLLDKTTLNAFMRELFNAEDSAALLNMPNIMETYASVNSVLNEYGDILIANESTTANAKNNDFTSHLLNEINGNNVATEGTNEQPSEQLSLNTEIVQTVDDSTSLNNSPSNENMSGNTQNDGFNAVFADTETMSTVLDENADVAINNVSASNNSSFINKAAIRAESTKNINTSDVVSQIVDKMKTEIKGNITEVKITLKPEHLGEVSMRIVSENGLITAQFVAENQRVKEVIESNFTHLKNALEQQGVQVSQLSVSVGQDETQKRMEQFIKEQKKSSGRVSRIISNINGVDDADQLETVDIPDLAEIYESVVNYTA